MKPVTDIEIKKLLSKAFWDLDISPDKLLMLLKDEIEDIDGFSKINLYRRLLTTFDWYTLLKLAPLKKITKMLEYTVLDQIYPKDLKEKFIYARKVLSR
jgi:hypothetical protein